MSVKDVTNLRKEGRLDEALALAERELNEDSNEWTRMSLFWVLRDYVKYVFIPHNMIDKAKEAIEQMAIVLPDMIDDNGAGERAYQSLRKQILPNADALSNLAELSKTDPNKAYIDMTAQFGKTGNNIDENLHEDFGWVVYRYMKANCNQLTSIQTRTLLRDYMLLKNERPSMLHSTVLNFALNFSKGHPDFSFYKFFIMWGVENLRYEDYKKGNVDGHEIPSLISRICRAIIDSREIFPVQEFINKFKEHKIDVIDNLRQSYFWYLMRLHKEGNYDDLWKSFDYYANNYSSLGSSHWHSEILKIANRFMIDENAYRFLSFMKQWDGPEMENLRAEDWEKEKGDDGNEYPSLAMKAAKKCFECVKTDAAKRNDNAALAWLKELYAQVIEHDREDDWSIRNYAKICIWNGCTEEAIDTYKSLLANMGDKYYLWSELAECITNDNALRIGLLLKAKELEKKEDFLGDIHLALAKLWIEENFYGCANQELCAYAKFRTEKGWAVSNLYLELSSKTKDIKATKENVDLNIYVRKAEDFAYADYEWHEYVLTEKWEHEGTERCNFFDGLNLSFSIKSKRFKALKKSKVGNVYRFRCRVTDDVKPLSGLRSWQRETATVKTVMPLVMALCDKEPWSLLPVKYGVVDYINKQKNVLHIITQESKQVFCTYKKDNIQSDSFVRFREYEDRRKDETITRIVDLHPCSKEEALPNMKSRIVVVDDVNEQKQLFHVVLGKNLISDIVRFNQTDIRPNIGDFLRITYCLKKNKEGKKHIKFLNIERSNDECTGVTGTVTGHLSLKYKDETWQFGDSHEPDYAFIKDFYVHHNILRKFNIKEDCDVTAKVILTGDNKWKVYDLIF